MSSLFKNLAASGLAPSKIYIGADHAGFALKDELIRAEPDLPWRDFGTNSDASVDYPDFANRVAESMKNDPKSIGVLLCGSGQGMAMRANRFPFLRAALCWSREIAHLSRAHNNANVLCLPSRFVDTKAALEILIEFLNTPFEGGRHERRVNKL